MDTKEAKVNYIKYWLQKFGDRDNESFFTKVILKDITWDITYQFHYDENGEEVEPYCWCSIGFKDLHDNLISNRTEEELDVIAWHLKNKQEYY